MTKPKAQIGIIGGSGLYELLEKPKEIEVNTPFGKPSDKITLGEYAGKKVAFLPRHGKKHRFPPHEIPYRANIYAFKKLGVQRIIAPCAAGSLTPKIKPGDFVICDQFIDRTKGREDSFYEDPKKSARLAKSLGFKKTISSIVHISCVDPYCPQLRKLAHDACKKLKIQVHPKGTVVVINGPRFSTRAESRFYSSSGFDIINMTQYPEAALARELEMCYVNISLVTDFDAGLEGMQDIYPVTTEEVVKVFKANIDKVKKLIFKMIEDMPEEKTCECEQTLEKAMI